MSIYIGTNGSDTVVGSSSSDIISGGNGNDVLSGGAGADLISGGNGSDTLDGGAGGDLIDGGNGNDTLEGGSGIDILSGGNGNDTLNGGADSDLVTGGTGDDVLIYRASENVGTIDIYDGSAGRDTLRLVVSQSLADTTAFQQELAQFKALLAGGSASFVFETLGLVVTSIERIEFVVEDGGNRPPVAVADTVDAIEDMPVTIPVSALLGNDSDPDANDTKTIISVDNAQNGTVTLDSGNVVFTPNANYSGLASFTYTMRDAAGATSTATVTVNVAAVNDAPAAVSDTVDATEDTPVTIPVSALLGNDSDPDASDTKTIISVDNAQNGTVTLDSGNVVFTPNANYSGLASFTYTMRDAAGATSTATVTVNVAAVNDAPAAVSDTVDATEDTPVTIPVSALLGNDSDPDASDTKTIISVDNAQNGTVALDGGNVVFTPNANYSGSASFTYTMRDTAGAESTTTVAVNVAPVADTPSIAASDGSGTADTAIPLSIEVTTADAGESLTIEITGVPSSYTLSAGSPTEGGYLLSLSDLQNLALVPVNGAGTPGEVVLTVTATSRDGTSMATATETVTVNVAPAATQQTGRVIDGYIAGATVFADANNDGDLDPGEAFTTTAADGTFVLTGGTGPLVMFGGKDVSTGLDFTGTMKAPSGSTVVTPLTTLVAELVAGGTAVEDAEDAVAAALGFDASIDLQTYDPVPDAIAGNPAAIEVLSAAIQVQSAITQLEAAGATSDVVGALADAIADGGATLNLTDPATMADIATDAGVSAAAIDAVAEVVAAAVGSIQAAADVTELAKAATVAQGETTAALATTDFNSPAAVQTLTDAYADPVALAAQITEAEVGDVDGPLLGTLANDVLTGTSEIDAIDGLDGDDAINAGDGDDLVYGGGGNDNLVGGAGDDLIDGGAGFDRSIYAGAGDSVAVQLAAGVVTAGAGIDTLRGIEAVRGSAFADNFDATGFTATSTNGGAEQGSFNEFEGLAGNDTVIGNNNTRIAFTQATAGVTVTFNAGNNNSGTSTGNASVGTDTFSGVTQLRGSQFDDTFTGNANFQQFEGRGGNDTLVGGGGMDRARYDVVSPGATGIAVSLAAGTVTGRDAAATAVVGTDTLRGIESVRGSSSDDVYDATGFATTGNAATTNVGEGGANGAGAAYNEFEGMGGNDQIIGNGNTRLTFFAATAGVTVDFELGTATGASIGTDTFTAANAAGTTGVSGVIGSNFDDTLLGSDDNGTGQVFAETFDGRAGNDTIDARGGFDSVIYDTATAGIDVAVSGGGLSYTVSGNSSVGTDTVSGAEIIAGTNFADTFDATGYVGASTDTGHLATFTEFQGLGGDDTITGNGNTRISYLNASAGVTVDLDAGTATGNGSVGSDTILGGVNRVRGSNFNDAISGDANANILEGRNGNDTIEGRGGNDTINGGGGDDRFVIATGSGADVITDFVAGTGTVDRIDLTAIPDIYDLDDVLAISTQVGPHVVLDFGGGNTLTLQNVVLGNLSAGDFVFATNLPPALSLTNVVAAVDEDTSTASSIKVADIVITDDGVGNNVLSLAGDDATSFELVGNELRLKAGTTLDFETKSSYSVTVQADDPAVGGTPDSSMNFVLAVGDVNEAPPNQAPAVTLANTLASIDENTSTASSVKVADIVVSDDGQGTNILSLTGADAALFEIVGNELHLKAGTVLDHELKASFDVRVQVDDSTVGATPDEFVDLTLSVADLNEAPSILLSNALTAIDENIPTASSIKVADIVVSDDALGTNSVTLVGAGAGFFEIVGTELHLKSGTVLDHEAQSSFSVTVQVDDGVVGGSPDAFFNYSLVVNNVNEAPGVSLANTVTMIDEGGPTGSAVKVADIVVTDDLLGSNSLSLAGADASAFEFVGMALYVKAGTVLDYETQASLNVTVQIDDDSIAGSPDASVGFTLTVGGVNETPPNQAPSVSLLNQTTSIDENTVVAASLKVADIVISDDGIGTNALALTGADAGFFEIVGTELRLKAGTVLDYESKSSFAVTVQVDDDTVGGTPDGSFDYTLQVANLSGQTITGTAAGETLNGTPENDTIEALAGDDNIVGGAGDDLIDGGAGFDRSIYAGAGDSVAVQLAAGVVTAGAAIDTLRGIEAVRGSAFADNFDATGFTATSTNGGAEQGSFNEFEGLAGNDTVIGNSNTRIAFTQATAGVTVTFNAGNNNSGTSTGNASVGTDTFSGVTQLRGSQFDDTFTGNANFQQFEGRGGNDTLVGGGGMDRARYDVVSPGATGIAVSLAAGTVTGRDAAATAVVGTDTLRGIESVRGSSSDDVYDATGFATTGNAATTNVGEGGANGAGAAYNEFEGMGGNDQIIGNGNTRLTFFAATAGVTVDFELGTATGASIGTDTFTAANAAGTTGVSGVIGSNFDDTLLGSDDNGTGQVFAETFDGRAGNDTIDARGGFDSVIYDTATAGIDVAVSGGGLSYTVSGNSSVGTDTVSGAEIIAGTNFADTFDATGYVGASTDTGHLATFTEFQGLGGDDTITGNGNTRISYLNASAGVTVDLDAGTATGNGSVGSDTILGGVNRVRGSNFNDAISGDANANILEGRNGNDTIEGRGGNDTINGGGGSDTFHFAAGFGQDVISDFNAVAGANHDLVRFEQSVFAGFAAVQAAMSQSGSDVIITAGSEQIRLAGVSLANMSADDFLFV